MTCDVGSSKIPRNERPLHWTYTEGVRIMKSKYKSCIFRKAAQVFALVMRQDDGDEIQRRWSVYRIKEKEMPDFESLEEKRQVLELVFGTLLYDKVYREVLDKRSFFYHYPELQKYAHVTVVVLHDMQSRKLLPGICDCEHRPDPCVRNVENAILNFRLKIAAEIARIRIENHATTFDQLRPLEFLRFKDPWVTSCHTTMSGWVNRRKKNIPLVIKKLSESGLKVDEIRNISEISLELNDVFSVRTDDPYTLLKHTSVRQNKFIVQDASCCIAPQCLVNTLLQQCRVALGHEYMSPHDRRVAKLLYMPYPPLYPKLGPWDVAVSDVGNGVTAAHLASLLHSFRFRGRVLAFGGGDAEEKLKIRNNESGTRVPGVQVIQKSLMDLSPEDDVLQNVRAVLIQPKCTRSAVVDPINFLSSEGGVVNFLYGLYQKEKKLEELCESQMKLLKFCLKLPNVQVIIYATHSTNQKENQDIVQVAVDDTNTFCEPSVATYDQVKTSSSSGDAVKHEGVPNVIRVNTVFEVSPIPVNAEGLTLKKSRNSPCIRIQPENGRNGCFVAAITRKEIPESFNPEAEGDSEDELAILFKDSPMHGISKSNSNTKRALELHGSEDECAGSLEDTDVENEDTRGHSGETLMANVKGIQYNAEKSKDKVKKPPKKENKGKKSQGKRAGDRGVAARKKTNNSVKGFEHSVSVASTPLKKRPKANSRLSERVHHRVTHSRLSTSSPGVLKKREASATKLETLTLSHFVAGKSQVLDPKFQAFLETVEKSKNANARGVPTKSKIKETSSPKRTPPRRRKRSKIRPKVKSEEPPIDFDEIKRLVNRKEKFTSPVSVKTLRDVGQLQTTSASEDTSDIQEYLSDYSDDCSESSFDEMSFQPSPSRKLKSLGQRRKRYERYHKLYLNSNRKENLDTVLADMLRGPETKNKNLIGLGNTPASVTLWKGKMSRVANANNSGSTGTFDSRWQMRCSPKSDGSREFDVYFPEADVLKLSDSVSCTAERMSGNYKFGGPNLEDHAEAEQWLMKNRSFGARLTQGYQTKKPVSFRNAAHVIAPELKLPASHRPEFLYQKEDHVCVPQKRTPPRAQQ